MKAALVLIGLALVLTGTATAQSQWGIQAGYSFNQLFININGLEQGTVEGRQAGVHWRTFSTPNAGIQLGLMWDEKGYELFANDPALNYRVKEYHISLPVQSAIVVGKRRLRLGISGGAYVDYILGRDIERGSALAIAGADLNFDFSKQNRTDWHYGLQGGLGPMFKVGQSWVQVEGRFAMALSNRYQPDLTLAGSLNTSQQQTLSVAVVWWWGKLPEKQK